MFYNAGPDETNYLNWQGLSTLRKLAHTIYRFFLGGGGGRGGLGGGG